MSPLNYQLLDKEQKKTFEQLNVFKKEAVLAGGTALSLQIAHRYSLDFDLFFDRPLSRSDFNKFKRIFSIKEVGVNTQDLLQLITSQGVRLHLVHYPFKPLFKKVPTQSLPLLTVKDIAADKAYTIGRRATWRDYVDLFVLLKEKYVTGQEVIKLARKKFGVEFNPRLFLEQLSYFQDLQISKISFVKKSYPERDIKSFLQKTAKDLTSLFCSL